MTELKQIHIKVPIEIYEAFYRKFPGRGERTQFLLEKICEVISERETHQWKEDKSDETKQTEVSQMRLPGF